MTDELEAKVIRLDTEKNKDKPAPKDKSFGALVEFLKKTNATSSDLK